MFQGDLHHGTGSPLSMKGGCVEQLFNWVFHQFRYCRHRAFHLGLDFIGDYFLQCSSNGVTGFFLSWVSLNMVFLNPLKVLIRVTKLFGVQDCIRTTLQDSFNFSYSWLITASWLLGGVVDHKMRFGPEFGDASSGCEHVERKMWFVDKICTNRERVKGVL